MYEFRKHRINAKSISSARRVASKWFPDEEGILFLIREDGELRRVSRRVVSITPSGTLITKWIDEE